MELHEFLAGKLDDNSSYRDLENKIKVSRGSLEKIIKQQNKRFPKIETLTRISIYYDKPLWEIMQMAGVKLGLPQSVTERVQRLDQLVARRPKLERLVERLYEKIDTDLDYVDGMIIGLEAALEPRPPQ